MSQTSKDGVITRGLLGDWPNVGRRVRISGVKREELTTERALACELLNELGFEELADRLAAELLEGPPCPWLDDFEHRALQQVLVRFPELGGPGVSFRMALGAAPDTPAQIPQPDGMLQLARAPDIVGSAGSIWHWRGMLSGAVMIDLGSATRAQGGRRSPLDLRAVLQQLGMAIERTAKLRRANPPHTARCVALLLMVDHGHHPFHLKVVYQPREFPYFDHMPWSKRLETQEARIAARKAASAEVMPVSRGVFRVATVKLINDEVRELIRDRRGSTPSVVHSP